MATFRYPAARPLPQPDVYEEEMPGIPGWGGAMPHVGIKIPNAPPAFADPAEGVNGTYDHANPGAVATKPPSALDRMAEVAARRPRSGDPALKPRPIERVAGALAGAGLGFAEGYLNSGPRGAVVRPGAGAAVSDAIMNRRYRNASRDWEDEYGKAGEVAKIEAQQKQAELTELTKRAQAENLRSQVSDREARAEDRKEAAADRDLQRQAYLSQMGAEETDPNAFEVQKPGEPQEYQKFQVGDKTYRKLSPYGSAKQKQAAEQASYVDVPPVIAEVFKHDPKRKVSPQQYERMLNTYATILDKKAARAENADLRRDLADQANQTRLAIKAMGNAREVEEDKLLTPTEAQSLGVPYGTKRSQAFGVNPEGAALSGKRKATLEQMDVVDSFINKLEQQYIKTGDLSGIGPFAASIGRVAKEKTNLGSDVGVDNRADVGSISAELLHEKYGSALSKGEQERARQFIPNATDKPAVVIQKLRRLREFHSEKRKAWASQRGSAPASNASGAGAPKVGSIVNIGGKQQRITKIFPDGTFDAEPVN